MHIAFAFDHFNVFLLRRMLKKKLFWGFVLNAMVGTKKHKIDSEIFFFQVKLKHWWYVSSCHPTSTNAIFWGKLKWKQVFSNSNFQHNNPIVQLVCQSGLPTFIPPVIKLSKIHVILEKGNQPNQRNKKEYDVFQKCKEIKAI